MTSGGGGAAAAARTTTPPARTTAAGTITTVAGITAVIAADARALIAGETLSDAAAAGLTGALDALAALGTAAAAAGAVLVAGVVIVFPSKGPVTRGEVPGVPGVSYLWNRDTGQLTFSRNVNGVDTPLLATRLAPNGLYYDPQFNTVDAYAAAVGGGLIINPDVVSRAFNQSHDDAQPDAVPLSSADADDEIPKLCPVPESGFNHHASDDAKAYQMMVSGQKWGTEFDLKGVLFDGCYEVSGIRYMVEAKAEYDQFLVIDPSRANDPNYVPPWDPFFENSKSGVKKFLRQMEKQSKAALPGPVIWHVKQDMTARALRVLAERFSNVKVIYDPNGTIRP